MDYLLVVTSVRNAGDIATLPKLYTHTYTRICGVSSMGVFMATILYPNQGIY
jgi:hypothetical protein